MSICIYCGKEFEISKKGSGTKRSRAFCYDCIPKNIDHTKRSELEKLLYREKVNQDKVNLGCSICGYNKSPHALEWHHPNDDKEDCPSLILDLYGYQAYLDEIAKCVLLCSNCHREVHDDSQRRLDKILELQSLGNNDGIVLEKDILCAFQELKTVTKVAEYYQMDAKTISLILTSNGIDVSTKKSVKQIDKITGVVLNEYPSIKEAMIALGKGDVVGHIGDVCREKRASAYGYKWEFVK